MNVDFLLVMGLVGSVLALIAFYLNQTDKLSNKSLWYDGLNAGSAFLLVIYAFTEAAWPFVLTNTVWFLVSFKDVVSTMLKGSTGKKKRKKR